MRRRLLFFTIVILIYALHANAWAQESGQTGGSISGTLLMLDDKTPHVAVPIEAINSGEIVDTVLSDENGKYQFIGLEPGRYRLRCQVLGGYVYYGKNGTSPEESQATYLQAESGRTLRETDLRFPAFKKGTWRNYTIHDGLPDNEIIAIYSDPDGIMWIGTFTGGVFRYDGRDLVNFTTEDGLASNIISSICRGPDGDMWFGTGDIAILGNGVSRYDGKEFHNYTTQDGLAGNTVNAIYCDPDGILWFGAGCFQAEAGGISQYDGKEFRSFTEEDGMVYDVVTSIHRAPDGTMWFGVLFDRVCQYDGSRFRSLPGVSSATDIHSEPDGTLWFATFSDGVYRYDGKELVNFTTRDGLADDYMSCIYRDPDGIVWFGTGTWEHNRRNGISRYDGKTFVNYTTHDGLAHNIVRAIHCDQDGVMWFGTAGGLSRYDEKTFTNLTTADGLTHNVVRAIHSDSDGVLWFGTDDGVSRYDGGELTGLTKSDGLTGNVVMSIDSDTDGNLWFGTRWNGVSLYDGKEFHNFNTAQGLVSSQIYTVLRAPDGIMWFGTAFGISSYDGKEFRTLTGEDALVRKAVWDIHSDPDGILWFGTLYNGVYRYNGKQFTNINTQHGLRSNIVTSIYSDPDGSMWFTGGGASRYDGETFRSFTKKDGLAHNRVQAIHRDPDGVVWFGTGGGASAYDGFAWTSLDMEDGLAGDFVSSIHQDEDGTLWFGTDGGVTRYRPSNIPPKVRIVSVKTRRQSYTDLAEIPPVTVGNDVTIEYSSIDFKTISRKRQYRYRIKQLDSDWRRPTKAAEFRWTPNKPGTYTFAVQAIDRDLNYSEPASVSFVISPLPFYQTGIFLVLVIIVGSLSLLAAILLGIQRWRLAYSERIRLQNELDDARRMQLNLLPKAAPAINGFDVAGLSRPAREVGGDFFDYLSLPDGKLGIALADVSGKGLQGAMNAILTNGMLHEVAIIEPSCSRILSRLNAHLYPLMEKRMFTAFSFAILDSNSGVIQWSNAAQPHPLIKRSDGASEAHEDGQLPLGMMPDVKYPDYELKLQTGDTVIFYTDGIIEAENEAEDMYGTERLLDAVAGIDSSASAEDVIAAILQDVSSFVGNAEQYDDMTIVVVRKLESSDAT